MKSSSVAEARPAPRRQSAVDTIRQIWVTRRGGPEALEIREAALPEPGPGEVRIRVRAIGINFAEVMIRLGIMPNAPKLPAVLGWEVAGEVEVGAGPFQKGDRVFALTEWGGYAEAVCVPTRQVFRLPDGWSFEAGAAFSVSYLVAYQALYVMGSARPGNTILVHGAAGAIGQAVAQLGKVYGCTVYGTASASKHDALRALGVTPIDYRAVDFVAEVLRLTGGRGVDLALDPIGGDHWRRSYATLAPTGRLVTYAMHQPVTSGSRSLLRMVKSFVQTPRYSMLDLLDQSRGVLGVNLGHLFDDREFTTCRAWIEALLGLAGEGRIQPAAGMVLPFDDVREAHALLQQGKNKGKVVLTLRA